MNIVNLVYDYIRSPGEDTSRQFYNRYCHSFSSPPPTTAVLQRAATTLLKRVEAGEVPSKSVEFVWAVAAYPLFPKLVQLRPSLNYWEALLPHVPPAYSPANPAVVSRGCLHYLPRNSFVRVITSRGAVEGRVVGLTQDSVILAGNLSAIYHPFFPVYLLSPSDDELLVKTGCPQSQHRFVWVRR